MIYVLSSDVNLSIKIDRSEVPQGLDIELFYEVENGYWFNDAEKVNLEWAIIDENNHLEENGSDYVGKLEPLQKRGEIITIDTSHFSEGKYTLWVHLDYWVMGKWETKHLSVKFTVT